MASGLEELPDAALEGDQEVIRKIEETEKLLKELRKSLGR
jgi:hypothetical protein